MNPSETKPQAGRGLRTLLALLLAALAMGLYARTTNYEFVNYDDYDYVVRNKVVQEGLSKRGFELAIQGGHSANWHPVTTLSHLLDVELFGITQRGAAGAHHRTSVLLHGLNAALCFLALLALTRRTWASALVAALFALHPQHVESVAWISERKDLLSGSFFFLTLLAWVRFARHGGRLNYLLVLLALALGLMSKQMLVSLPCLLVLLDIWPLKRWSKTSSAAKSKTLGALLFEKLPLVTLSVLSMIPMWMAQTRAGTMGNLGLAVRLENAFAALFHYIFQMLWPLKLAPFYPHPALVNGDTWGNLHLPALLGGALVLGLSLLAVRRIASTPYLAVGWFWFLGMLVPVIGLVQVGSQSHADRYTYLPSIGLYLIIAMLLDSLVKRKPALARGLQLASVVVLGLCFLLSWKQVAIWKNSKTLNRHALQVTELNYVAHNNYGLYYMEDGADPVQAAEHFERALGIRGNYVQAAENLAASFTQQQRIKDAIVLYEEILRQEPGNARVLARLSKLKASRGDTQAAFDLLVSSTKQDPGNAFNWIELGHMHLTRNEGIYAEECAAKALALEPRNTRAHILHSMAARMLGYAEAAVTRIQSAVDSDPTHVEARLTQCRIFADQGRVLEAEEVCAALLELEAHNVQANILWAKFLMLRHKAAQMQAQQGTPPAAANDYLEQAKLQLKSALEEAPNNPEGLEFYGLLLMEDQLFDEAEAQFKRAIEVRPDFPSTLLNLGGLYENLGREAEALVQYRRLMETSKDSPNARVAARAIAWILATSPLEQLHDADEAVRMGNFALRSFRELNINEPFTFETVAAAFARAGRWEDAVKHQEVALRLAQSAPQRALHSKRLQLYKDQTPFQRASN